MRKLLLINLFLYKDIFPSENNKNEEVSNTLLINSYFNNDGTRKINNLDNLKYFIIVPFLIYFSISILFTIIYFVINRKISISFWFLDDYFNYKIQQHNNKYLY